MADGRGNPTQGYTEYVIERPAQQFLSGETRVSQPLRVIANGSLGEITNLEIFFEAVLHRARVYSINVSLTARIEIGQGRSAILIERKISSSRERRVFCFCVRIKYWEGGS
jgi:hypothetical protein